nr:SMP-30/gluconolactonase/LRE family protein [uncultured Allomuricauda sp.]
MKTLIWSIALISFTLGAQTTWDEVELSFQKDLIPEGIAVDVEAQKLYINSLMHNKIVRCNLDGSQTEDFIKNGKHGYLSGFGMTIQGDTLFALGNSLTKPRNSSILLLLNTKTGKLIKSYTLDKPGFAYLNDLAVSKKGEVFITDSESNHIYTINKEEENLEIFLSHDDLKHSNGIAISSNDKYLYFASYASGLRILDIASKKLVNPPNNYKGIDGLKFYKNKLIAIVNGKRDQTQNGVYQFQLNAKGTAIEIEEKIWKLKNETDIPTTFDIENDALYFVADSQMDQMNQETNTIRDESKLEDYSLIIKSLKPKVQAKNYCTEIGRFDLLIDADEVAGSYLLIHKDALGGVWGRLKGNVMTGRWHDADGKGDIIITFTEDFSFFTADYRSDDEPEKWHKDSWHGALRPDTGTSFDFNNKTYQCE